MHIRPITCISHSRPHVCDEYRMQIGSIPALLTMHCVDVHLLSPTLATSPCSLYFLDLYQSSAPPPPPISLSLTHFKENPYPSESTILLGAYGWSAVASFPLCCSLPPLCPHSLHSNVWVEDKLPLQTECLTWMYGLRVGVHPLHELNYHPPAIPCCHMHPRWEGERDTDRGYLWHSDACLTLEEANHRIEVLRMMGYRLLGGGVL